MPKSYILKVWVYPIFLFFFFFTFLFLFLSTVGVSIFSFWQNLIIFFISGNSKDILLRILFAIIYLFLTLFFVYLIKIEFFPTFLERITILKGEDGRVSITQKAIWELVEKELDKFSYVKSLKMYVTSKDGTNFRLHLFIDLIGNNSDLRNIEEKAYLISKSVKESIFNKTGIKIDKVMVSIEGVKYQY